jgi:nicotinamidase-related amidase
MESAMPARKKRSPAGDFIDLHEIQGLAPLLYTEPVDPAKTALIVVDMQRQFCKVTPPDRKWMDATIANIRKLLAVFRKERLRIVHLVLACWTDDGAEMAPHLKRVDAWRRVSVQTPRRQIYLPDCEIIPGLRPRRGEIVLQKVTPTAFASTGLDCILRNMGIQYVMMTGTITHSCEGSTAMDAAYHYGYAVTVVSDASVAPKQKASHRAWLSLFGAHPGRVRSTEEVIAEIRDGLRRSHPSATLPAANRRSPKGGACSAIGDGQRSVKPWRRSN